MPGSSQDFLDMFTGMGGKGMDGEQKRLSDMRGMNGMQFDTGERSQGAQELNQKVMQNTMSGVQQRTANLMQNLNPYNSLYPGSPENPMDPMGVPLVPGPDGKLINENLMKLTGGDRDELERRRQILGGM